jgi:hypothetical protein
VHAEYLRITRMMLPRLSEITTPWICFHGEGAPIFVLRHEWSIAVVHMVVY